MAKLYFYYASMNAGKSTNLLQANFNYHERGMQTMLRGLTGVHSARDAYSPKMQQVHDLFAGMTVRENLEMGGFLEPLQTRQRIEGLLARFPMLAEKRRSAARTLSGGQRQILAMAMALMVQPRLLLLDEPSAGLSPKAAEGLFDSIAAIHAEGTAIAMVEQNAQEALAIADTGVILVDGRTARVGPARALAADPETRRMFLGG